MKNKYIVRPYEGFDEILFDETRDAVRKKLGEYKEFRKNKFSENTLDAYEDFHFNYDKLNKLEAVEFFEGEIYFENEKLFPNSKNEFIAVLSRFDKAFQQGDDLIKSEVLGITAYIPEEKVETLLIHKRGYYS